MSYYDTPAGQDELRARLFIGTMPAGICYADKELMEHGDYRRVAFLPYATLELKVSDPASDLLQEVKDHAATIQARRGEDYQVDACGHTVTLGGRS